MAVAFQEFVPERIGIMSDYYSAIAQGQSLDLTDLESSDKLNLLVPDSGHLREVHRQLDQAQPRIHVIMEPGDDCVSFLDGIDEVSTGIRIESGFATFTLAVRPELIWPDAEAGALQVFWHTDWPGSAGNVNVNPGFWGGRPATLEQIALRARLLPHLPIPLTGLAPATTQGRCTTCSTLIDRRFTHGHGIWTGEAVVRVGTDEMIMLVDDAETSGIREKGPLCRDCVEGLRHAGGRVPRGLVYNRDTNRSWQPDDIPPRRELGLKEDPDPVLRARARYGEDAIEFSYLEVEPGCAERLARLDRLS